MVTYRAYYQDIAPLPARPTVTCEVVPGGVKLTASNATYHLWSTGETTQEITVATTGTYQVWVNQGIGLLGSIPIEVNDLNACGTIGIHEFEENMIENIVGYYDVLGKELQEIPVGSIYIVRFDSGRIEKRYQP